MTSLVLKITSQQNVQMGHQATKTFGVEGGSIGRAAGNNWVLPDPARFLSSQHALISFQDDQFFVTDLSSNGLFINGEDEPIGKGNTKPLNQVFSLSLGEYSIEVSINNEISQTDSLLSDNLVSDTLISSSSDEGLIPDNITHDPMDLLNSVEGSNTPKHFDLPDDLFGDGGENNQFIEEQIQNEGFAPPQIDDAFTPPNIAQPSQASAHLTPDTNSSIPENWDKTSFVSIPSPAAQPSKPPTPTPQPTPQPESLSSINTHAQNIESENYNNTNNDPFSLDILDSDPFASSAQTTGQPESKQKFNDEQELNAGLLCDSPALEEPDFTNDQTLISPNQTEAAALSEPFKKPQPTTSVQHAPQTSNHIKETPSAAQSKAPPLNTETHLHQQHTERETNQFKIAKATFKANGLDPALLSDPSFVDQAVALLPYFLDGTLDILRSRANIKNELRASKTILQSIENNPLKFSVNLQDAIQNIMINQRPGFLSPTDSVQQAFEDLAQHEAALIAGIQAGLNGLLEKMNPDTIETKIESHESKKNLFGKISSSKKWNFYKETYQQILENSSSSFVDMFGNDFVNAYESHINNQKQNGK